MKRSHKKGIVFSILSGVLWASYCVTLYCVLNPYYGDTGELTSVQGVMFIILAAVGIAWIDSLITGVFEILYVIKLNKFDQFKKLVFTKTLLKIAPAALFAGPLGLVPFAIASRYSASVATSISAFYPALGSIIAMFWFKDKLTPVKFVGLLFAVSGVVVITGFSGLHIVGIALAIVASVGYSLELVFGYRLMADDVDADVSLALKQVSAIIMYTLIVIVFMLIPGNFEFIKNLFSLIDFSDGFTFLAPVMGNIPLVIAVFVLASFFNAAAYVAYFQGMNNAGVSTASSLNIAYGIWTIIILALPPFSQTPNTAAAIGAVLTFIGSSIVIFESNRLEQQKGE